MNQDTKPDLALTDSFLNPQQDTVTLLQNTDQGSFPTCNSPNATVGINVCSPAQGTTQTHVKFRIGAAGLVPLRKLEVWIDGAKRDETFNSYSYYSFMDTTLQVTPGTHSVTIFAAGWDDSLISKKFQITAQ